eukprot:scaffold656823_cov57-Prasinocladus_malaysianus.AAC.1
MPQLYSRNVPGGVVVVQVEQPKSTMGRSCHPLESAGLLKLVRVVFRTLSVPRRVYIRNYCTHNSGVRALCARLDTPLTSKLRMP